MKYITLIIGLLVVGCATTPTIENVAGEYVGPAFGQSRRLPLLQAAQGDKWVFLENGVIEGYDTTGKRNTEGKWHIKGVEIHFVTFGDYTRIWRINEDGDLYLYGHIVYGGSSPRYGRRSNFSKDKQITYKKIK